MNVPPGFDEDFGAASDWALEYRKHGIQVVPCANKMPALKTWKQYQGALVSQQVFDGWYGLGGQFVSLPDMGMLTGTASDRILMVDLDLYKPGGEVALNWWLGILAVHNNAMELETWEQFTGGGGRQLFFRYPAGWSCANAKTDIHVDIRGQGGFAVLPPTRHASGKQYVWEEGRAPWEIPLLEAPAWLLEEIERLVREHGGGGAKPHTNGPAPPGQGAFDGFGHQTDGREEKMYRLVWGAVVDWRRAWTRPGLPSDAEQRMKAAEKYLVYQDLVSPRLVDPSKSKAELLDAENRGPDAFWRKWAAAMAQWEADVKEEAAKPPPDEDLGAQFEQAAGQAKAAGDIYPFLDVGEILAKPDPVWVVDGLINEKCLGFIFGPHSTLKTFIALDLALSLTAKLPTWWGRAIKQHGAVVYLCREGTASLKFRIKAWQHHRKTQPQGTPFYLIEHPTNFMHPDDVGKVLATVEAIAAKAGLPIAAVFVDTVSRVLPGAEENLQRDMTMFIAACEAIQVRFDCVVVGLHHVNKSGSIRGSTVLPGAGDFLIETRREPGSMVGSLVIQKVKDGEDGMEVPFKVTKIELGGIVSRTSLVVDPTAAGAQTMRPKDGLPDRTICIEILAALAQAWFQKAPWCKSTQGERPAVEMIMGKWKLKREPVKQLLMEWLANGIVEYVVYDTRSGARGYRKVIDL